MFVQIILTLGTWLNCGPRDQLLIKLIGGQNIWFQKRRLFQNLLVGDYLLKGEGKNGIFMRDFGWILMFCQQQIFECAICKFATRKCDTDREPCYYAISLTSLQKIKYAYCTKGKMCLVCYMHSISMYVFINICLLISYTILLTHHIILVIIL